MAGLRVISPGFLTTVQDLGRFGYAHLGISASGACDALSLRLANLLVGNPENTPGLEMSLIGAELQFDVVSIIALAGADMQPALDRRPIPMWTSITIKPGQVLKCGTAATGVRTYLCVRGGIDIPLVFGSASTHAMTRLGGFHGRALKKGDSVPLKDPAPPDSFRYLRVHPKLLSCLSPHNALRVIPGPQSRLFDQESHRMFFSSSYQVTPESDRMGLRLEGPPLARTDKDLEILTEGVSLGAVQITHLGTPIILFVDHQTTGGYPKIANVISADLHDVGQLRPHHRVTFTGVSLAEAHRLLKEQETLIHTEPFIPA